MVWFLNGLDHAIAVAMTDHWKFKLQNVWYSNIQAPTVVDVDGLNKTDFKGVLFCSNQAQLILLRCVSITTIS